MKIYDISMTIHDNMSVWDNKEAKKPKFITTVNYQTSDVYETTICMDMHTGTHIDAPLHMIKNGDKIEDYNLNQFIVKSRVLDFSHVKDKITVDDLKTKEINKNEFILLKTTNSNTDLFLDDFVYLDKDGAEYLVEKGVLGVGTDGMGIERDQEGFPTHITLLNEDIIILEGLRLKHIKEGTYLLIALPLKIKNVEATPCRAVLIER
ncbi:TPA: cyclase family protein [bacterium]|jgi:arylformamidase|nr:cyclase family protein [bacterium]